MGTLTRSLGVPTPAWRIYQTGLNMILLVYLKNYQHPAQHGFVPHKGTDSAWQQIDSEVLKAKFIYEFDLKEFFDRVNLDYLSKVLKKLEIPDDLVHHLIGWSRIKPSIPEKIRNCNLPSLPKQKRKAKWKQISETNANIFFDKQLKWEKATDLNWLNRIDRKIHLKQHLSLSNKERNFYKDFRGNNWKDDFCYFNGIAQGSPLSPTLATLELVPTLMLSPLAANIFYADDGLLYSNTIFDPSKILDRLNPSSGISVHDEGPKRGWVKYDGTAPCAGKDNLNS